MVLFKSIKLLQFWTLVVSHIPVCDTQCGPHTLAMPLLKICVRYHETAECSGCNWVLFAHHVVFTLFRLATFGGTVKEDSWLLPSGSLWVRHWLSLPPVVRGRNCNYFHSPGNALIPFLGRIHDYLVLKVRSSTNQFCVPFEKYQDKCRRIKNEKKIGRETKLKMIRLFRNMT